ncbi:MAG: ribonuclease P protein component [Pseudomonadota bacterium]
MARRLRRLVKRAQFLNAAKGRKVVKPGFVLQLAEIDTSDEVGVGFTASKRVGNAVERNRARRRLREAARLVLPDHGLPGHDHVLVARRATLAYPFAALTADLTEALTMARAKAAKR